MAKSSKSASEVFRFSNEQSTAAASQAIYSPIVAAQYRHLEAFHSLLAQWSCEPVQFPFASKWIETLTGICPPDNDVAHSMIVKQVARAKQLHPDYFASASSQAPGVRQPAPSPKRSTEISPRATSLSGVSVNCSSSTSSMPTDSRQLEEVFVCHLSAMYLRVHPFLTKQQPIVLAPALQSHHKVDVADSVAVAADGHLIENVIDSEEEGRVASAAPLPLQPTPAELYNLHMTAGPKPPRPKTCPATNSRHAGGQVWDSHDNNISDGASNTTSFVNLGIARAVCRPGAQKVGAQQPPILSVVQDVLSQHEAVAAQHHKQQHSSGGNSAALETIFTVERMKEVKRKIEHSNAEKLKHEALLEVLRSPRSLYQQQQHQQPHTVHHGGGTCVREPHAAPAALQQKQSSSEGPLRSVGQRPHTAGNAVTRTTFGSTSHRANPVKGVIESAMFVAVVPTAPSSSKASWSSRIIPPSANATSATVVVT